MAKKTKRARSSSSSSERSKSRSRDRHRRRKHRERSLSSSKSPSHESKNRKRPIDGPKGREKWGRDDREKSEEKKEQVKKELPNFEPSGILAEYYNTESGIVRKFTEPTDAKVPSIQWFIFPFKGEDQLPTIHLQGQSSFLFGREDQIANILLENTSCSAQHAVIQFREVKKFKDDGTVQTSVKPYLMDLESANGTFLNGKKIEAARYYELFPKDIVRFGLSMRDYVIMKE